MATKSAIRRRNAKDTATDNHNTLPATTVRCKYCYRTFATISAEGGLNPYVPHEQACNLCEPFVSFYDTSRATEQEHTALLDRGTKHHGRIIAHEQFRKARVALENFLVSIEAPNNASFDVAQAGFANRTEPDSLERAQELEDLPNLGDSQGTLDIAPPPGGRIALVAASSTAKRRLAQAYDTSNGERKRIKFGEDVEERPEYRGTLEYYRGAKEYVPGRYAVTEGSEFEDTSGSTVSFAKFTGQRKVGSRFVDIVPKEGAKGEAKGPSAAKKISEGGSRKIIDGLDKNRSLVQEKDEGQMNNRGLRLSRRARSTMSPAASNPQRVSVLRRPREDTSKQVSNGAPALVLPPKMPNGQFLVNGRPPTHVPQPAESQRFSDDAGEDNAAIAARDSAAIKKVLSSIDLELSLVQQTVVSPKYMEMLPKAVHGCQKALEQSCQQTNQTKNEAPI